MKGETAEWTAVHTHTNTHTLEEASDSLRWSPLAGRAIYIATVQQNTHMFIFKAISSMEKIWLTKCGR